VKSRAVSIYARHRLLVIPIVHEALGGCDPFENPWWSSDGKVAGDREYPEAPVGVADA